MDITCGVLTISDKGFLGQRDDTSGPAVRKLLEQKGWSTAYSAILPDEKEQIIEELLHCTDDLKLPLIITTGGTGFSPRDITPEATKEVIEREVPGIPMLMMMKSLEITDRACLSRAACGIRGRSLILNLPGSEKAVRENLSFALPSLEHGLELLLGEGSADCAMEQAMTSEAKTNASLAPGGLVLAVCIGTKKGTRKQITDSVHFIPNYGIEGDVHAGTPNRNISLLANESVGSLRPKTSTLMDAGIFAENILTAGIRLHTLPVGTKLQIGPCLCEITQIGKECHSDCEIRRQTGDCVMPREGIFVKALTEGDVKPGDPIKVLF